MTTRQVALINEKRGEGKGSSGLVEFYMAGQIANGYIWWMKTDGNPMYSVLDWVCRGAVVIILFRTTLIATLIILL